MTTRKKIRECDEVLGRGGLRRWCSPWRRRRGGGLSLWHLRGWDRDLAAPQGVKLAKSALLKCGRTHKLWQPFTSSLYNLMPFASAFQLHLITIKDSTDKWLRLNTAINLHTPYYLLHKPLTLWSARALSIIHPSCLRATLLQSSLLQPLVLLKRACFPFLMRYPVRY